GIEEAECKQELVAHAGVGVIFHLYERRVQTRKFVKVEFGNADGILANSSDRIFQSVKDNFGIQRMHSLECPKGVQPAEGRVRVHAEFSKCRYEVRVVAIDQQSLRVNAPPGVGMVQRLDQLFSSGPAEIQVVHPRWLLSIYRCDAIDATLVAIVIQGAGLYHLITHPFGMFNDLAIVVDNIKRAVRTYVQVDRSEFRIARCKKFTVGQNSAGNKTCTVGLDFVDVDEVAHGLGHECHVLIVGWGKGASEIRGQTTCRCDYADVSQKLVFWVDGDGKHLCCVAMIGERLRCTGYKKIGVAFEITCGNDFMVDVIGIANEEMAAPEAERLTEL